MSYYTSLTSASVVEPGGRGSGGCWAEYRLKTAVLLVALGLVLLVWRMTPQTAARDSGISRNVTVGIGTYGGRGSVNRTGSRAPEGDTSGAVPPSASPSADLDYFSRADEANAQIHELLPRLQDVDS